MIVAVAAIGPSHRRYWADSPSMSVPRVGLFSLVEVLTLMLPVIEAIRPFRPIRVHPEFNDRLAASALLAPFF